MQNMGCSCRVTNLDQQKEEQHSLQKPGPACAVQGLDQLKPVEGIPDQRDLAWEMLTRGCRWGCLSL